MGFALSKWPHLHSAYVRGVLICLFNHGCIFTKCLTLANFNEECGNRQKLRKFCLSAHTLEALSRWVGVKLTNPLPHQKKVHIYGQFRCKLTSLLDRGLPFENLTSPQTYLHQLYTQNFKRLHYVLDWPQMKNL